MLLKNIWILLVCMTKTTGLSPRPRGVFRTIIDLGTIIAMIYGFVFVRLVVESLNAW